MSAHGLLPVRLVAADGSRAVIYPFGAHVTSWRTANGREQLYLSGEAALDGSAAIRGGIPVIFPQFASEGPLPKHGFARTAMWRVLDAGNGLPAVSERWDAASRVTHDPGSPHAPSAGFELVDSPATRALWPHAFRALVRVTLLPRALDLALVVENTGSASMAFTAALHTYLALDDAFRAEVWGLQGHPYRDSITRVPAVQDEPVLRVTGAVNRVYAGAPGQISVRDGGRTLGVEAAGFRDAVVWNPGMEGEGALGDMPSGDSRRMLCVEPAVVEQPIVVLPGERWTAWHCLTAEIRAESVT